MVALATRPQGCEALAKSRHLHQSPCGRRWWRRAPRHEKNECGYITPTRLVTTSCSQPFWPFLLPTNYCTDTAFLLSLRFLSFSLYCNTEMQRQDECLRQIHISHLFTHVTVWNIKYYCKLIESIWRQAIYLVIVSSWRRYLLANLTPQKILGSDRFTVYVKSENVIL